MSTFHIVKLPSLSSITYSNNPSFEEYYDTYIIDAEGNTAEYTRFQGGLYGVPGKNYSSSIGLSIQNVLEAKVKPKDSTETELRKINIFFVFFLYF